MSRHPGSFNRQVVSRHRRHPIRSPCLGEELSVIWEFDVGQTVTPPGLAEHIYAEGFDDPVTLAGL
jgi:hypothetical protein